MSTKESRYYTCSYKPDLTEGRGFTQRTHIQIQGRGSWIEEEQLKEYLYKRLGPKVAYVQGVSPTPNWELRESTEALFRQGRGITWGGYDNPATRLVLENHGPKGMKVISEEESTGPLKEPLPDPGHLLSVAIALIRSTADQAVLDSTVFKNLVKDAKKLEEGQ